MSAAVDDSEEQIERYRRLSIALAVGLVVALAVGIGMAVWWYPDHREIAAQDDAKKALAHYADADEQLAGEQAEKAAGEMLAQMTTYSYKTIETDFAWLDNYATPKFVKAYKKDLELVQKALKADRLSAEGTVVDLAHRTLSETKVVVVAFVDQRIFEPGKNANATCDENRMRLLMVRKEGDWRIESLETVSSQNDYQLPCA